MRGAALGGCLALLAGLGACCPDGPRADGGAVSVEAGGGDGTGAAGLAAIQRELFDRQCVSDCHEALNPAAGLALTKERSYAALVNQPSQQIIALSRVLPGDPLKSYLFLKLEGSGIVGVQMPKGAPAATAAERERVRAWIVRGAAND